jgi:hypothetical protein
VAVVVARRGRVEAEDTTDAGEAAAEAPKAAEGKGEPEGDEK